MLRVVQRGDGASLLLEALAVRAIERFDRDRAAESGVDRLVDLAHAPGADGRDDLVQDQACDRAKGASGERDLMSFWGRAGRALRSRSLAADAA